MVHAGESGGAQISAVAEIDAYLDQVAAAPSNQFFCGNCANIE